LSYVAVFQDYYPDGNKRYNITIGIDVSVSDYSFSIFEREKHFDNIFKEYLKNIIPDLSENYYVSDNSYCYNKNMIFRIMTN
jgi:hypothetical protein